jgi:hypothetical protein
LPAFGDPHPNPGSGAGPTKARKQIAIERPQHGVGEFEMPETNTRPAGLDTDVELRRRHRKVVADDMSRKGENRLTRYLLFTEDGSAGLYPTDTGEPVVNDPHSANHTWGRFSSTV